MNGSDCRSCYIKLFFNRKLYMTLFVICIFMAPACWELSAYFRDISKLAFQRIADYFGCIFLFTGIIFLSAWYKLKNNQFH